MSKTFNMIFKHIYAHSAGLWRVKSSSKRIFAVRRGL